MYKIKNQSPLKQDEFFIYQKNHLKKEIYV